MHSSLYMKTMNRCACGKVMTKYARECRACYAAKMARIHAEAQAVVATGRCPLCGSGLRRNLSLTGWVQCEQVGAVGFRKDAARPACGFQVFTE
jgi:hypothetical protein